jgi:poly-gamma-glutamate synthesis protein (capsule biosynthesis protein)
MNKGPDREDKRRLRLAAMGDIMLARDVGRHYAASPSDFTMPEIRALLGRHDIALANLENPVSRNGKPHPKQKPNVTFCATPETLNILEGLSIDAVSLGNNHLLDYGPEALLETVFHLDKAGIRHAGAGRDYGEANQPVFIEKGGFRLAILSHVFIYSASTEMARQDRPGVSDHRLRKILSKVRNLRKAGNIVIVTIHWGLEYAFYPIPYQMRQARRMIDCGASLVIGHGPHYAQGTERYRDGMIVYSLGNFIFDEPYRFSNRGYIFSATLSLDGRLTDSRIYPIRLVQHVPQLTTGSEQTQAVRRVEALSRAYTRRNRSYWRDISSRYFSDIVNRVLTMRSIKFLKLPPPRFYLEIGIRNILKKIRITNILSMLSLAKR